MKGCVSLIIQTNILCADFESALGCPYDSPGSTQLNSIHKGVDCSGLFVAAFRHQGASLPHGSNAIARGYTEDLAPISSDAQLQRGQVLFKWKEKGTPAKYKDDLGNYHHMGLVTQTNPLRIIHASSAAGQVTCDATAKAWSHMGWLKGTEQQTSKEETIMNTTSLNDSGILLQVTASPALRVRSGPGTGYARSGSLKQGQTAWADMEQDGWYHLRDCSGWVCGKFVTVLQQAPQADRLSALEQRVSALEAILNEREADDTGTAD